MGIAVQAIVPRILNPLPHRELERFFGRVRRIIVPELNFTGQLASVLRSVYRVPTMSLAKVKGVPMEPREIVSKIIEAAASLDTRRAERDGTAG
jgi:2-oxoglutarate ferredoxin oxidoreductase subunit alpha